MEFKIGNKVRIQNIEEMNAAGQIRMESDGLPDYLGCSDITLSDISEGVELTVKSISNTYVRYYAKSGELIKARYINFFEKSGAALDFNLVLTDKNESFWETHFRCGEKVVILEGYDEPEIIGQILTVDSLHSLDTYVLFDEFDDSYHSVNERCIAVPEEDYVPPRRPRKMICNRCGSFYSVMDINEIRTEDLYLCPTCRERRYITPYHHYQPPISFCRNEDEPEDGLYFGVELEVDKGGEYNDSAAQVMDILNENKKLFTYCSHDGSLETGFEIITQPASIGYHRSMKPIYEKAFKWLVKNHYRSHNTSTAGMHIHFSREFYEDNEEEYISKLLYLVATFWDDFVVFSRRDYSTLECYAKKIDTDPNEFYNAWNKEDEHDGHYYSVNICNENTIELRMFKGTLNVETFMATIEFVNSLVRLAKEKSTQELQRMEFKDLVPESAMGYYMSRLAIQNYEET